MISAYTFKASGIIPGSHRGEKCEGKFSLAGTVQADSEESAIVAAGETVRRVIGVPARRIDVRRKAHLQTLRRLKHLAAVFLLCLFAGCTTLPPEPICPTIVTVHKPTAAVPFTWTEEAMKPGWHDTLYHQGRTIPGIPKDYQWDEAEPPEPTVVFHTAARR